MCVHTITQVSIAMMTLYLPLREMLSPKSVQIPKDMVSAATTVTKAVKPRPILDLTKSIFPGGRERRGLRN